MRLLWAPRALDESSAARRDDDAPASSAEPTGSKGPPSPVDVVRAFGDGTAHDPDAFASTSFEAKAAELLPAPEVPKTPSALGAWWGRFTERPAVRAVVLGLSGFAMAIGGSLASAKPAQAKPKRREIVMLGMNAGAKHEAKSLRKYAREGVALAGPSRLQDRALVDGRIVDLATDRGRAAFAASLGLPAPTRAAVTKLLANTEEWGKDEMARLVRLFAEAERGDRAIERMILSGHSLGTGVWGDDNGEIGWADLAALARTFPKAARQVEDLMVSACYAGGRTQANRLKAIFPRLKTLWGYHGSAPGAYSGAVWHLKAWEKQTRGAGEPDRKGVAHLRKGKSVATWSETRGYDDGKPKAPLTRLRADYARTRDLVPLYVSGQRTMANPGRAPLREHYGNLQRLLQRPETPDAERADLETERDLVIRLIYYPLVAQRFTAHHAATVTSAYEDLGLEAPDFAQLSRKAALAAVQRFARAADQAETQTDDVREARALLTEGLRDLDPERIPSGWL